MGDADEWQVRVKVWLFQTSLASPTRNLNPNSQCGFSTGLRIDIIFAILDGRRGLEIHVKLIETRVPQSSFI